jgi:hypothetical protein
MGARGFFSLIIALVAAGSLLPENVQAACTTVTLSANQTINGTLASSDCVDNNINGNIYYYDHFVFVGVTGQALMLAVSSTQADPDLLLITPSGEMLYDDDGGGGTSARIAGGLAETGTFQVIVSSAVPLQTGNYTFTFTLSSSSGGGGTTPTATAVEYFHAGFNHYFMTAYPAEATAIDGGSVQGWIRTGQTYTVNSESASGLSPVCRFFSTSFAPKSSHFYTPAAAECAAVKNNPNWKFEANAFNVREPSGGSCMSGTVPLYRVYNDGRSGAPNHRYTTCTSIRDNMLSHGWVSEGIAMCIPAGSSNCTVDASGGGTNYVAGPGNSYTVGPAGGTINNGGLSLTFPAGALSSTTNVSIATSQPDTSFTPDVTVVSDAYQITLSSDLQKPITLSFAATSAPAAGDLPLAAVVDDGFVSTFDKAPHKGVQLVEASYSNGRYTVTMPATSNVSTIRSKSLTRKAETRSWSFTMYMFGGYAMRQSTHFNLRFPARSCSIGLMDEWLAHAEEAWTRLVTQMGFTTFGLGLPETRLTMDVHRLGPGVDGQLSINQAPWGLFNNWLPTLELASSMCLSPTADQKREMKATIGHEFFHAIQKTYEPDHAYGRAIFGNRGQCLYDASSSWFEGEMLDSKSYLGTPTWDEVFKSNPFYTKGLGYGCMTDSDPYGYGMATFLRYLTEKYGRDLVLSLWRSVFIGSSDDVPADHMAGAGIRLGSDWPAFAENLLIGTTSFGWPATEFDGTLTYKAGETMKIVDNLHEMSAKKYKLDFKSLKDSTSNLPVCRVRLTTGGGLYNVVLYDETRKVADVLPDRDPSFTPTASDKYSLLVINIDTSSAAVNGVPYGRESPVEVAVNCGGEESNLTCGDNDAYEITIDSVPSMESFACNLSSTERQTARLCVVATNGVVKERSGTCYSNLQSVSGSIDSSGNYSLDFRWGGYGASSLIDGAGTSGSLVTGRVTGRFKGTSCVIDGTVNGEFHAWMTPNVSSRCYSGYDIRQKFTSTGKSN